MQLPSHVICADTTAAIDLARERATEQALDHNPEWILYLDSDVIPPRDVFHQLLDHDLDVCSGMYMVDKNPPHPAAWALTEDDNLSALEEWYENTIINVDAVGLGCCMVNQRVFNELEKPYFRWTEGYEEHPWDIKDDTEQKGVGEDFYFCHKVQEAGYNIYVDSSIQCYHEKPGLLSAEGFVPASNQRDTRQ